MQTELLPLHLARAPNENQLGRDPLLRTHKHHLVIDEDRKATKFPTFKKSENVGVGDPSPQVWYQTLATQRRLGDQARVNCKADLTTDTRRVGVQR